MSAVEHTTTQQDEYSEGLPNALLSVEAVAVAPVPLGTMRLWISDLSGALRKIAREWEQHSARLEQLRSSKDESDRLADFKHHQLRRRATIVDTSLRALLRLVRSAGGRARAADAADLAFVEALRRDVLDWIAETRATWREHVDHHQRQSA